jgi:uncharacterized protein
MQEKIYYIRGMHCASCELLIEEKLLKQQNIQVVDASVGNGTLRIDHTGNPPHIKDLNKWFKSDGYHFSEEKQNEKKTPLFYFKEGKGVQYNKKVLQRKISAVKKITVVFIVLFLLEKTGATSYISVTENSSLGLFFLLGIVAGLSSCAALVGGILLSLTKKWNEQFDYTASTKEKMSPHFFFHGGRILAYGLFGGVLGALGSSFTLENITVYAVVTLLVSVVMMIVGLQMAGVPWAEKLQLRMPKFVTRKVAGTKKGNTSELPFVIGAGTVLLPCGFTLIAQGIALTSGGPVKGALMMLLFVLGTMIPLLFIGLVSIRGTKDPKRSRAFSFYAGVVLVIFALYNVNGQMNVLGLPSLTDIIPEKTSAASSLPASTNSKGEQILTMTAKGFSYSLTSGSTIQAGVPTKLVVNDQGIQGCGIFLAARGLISGFVELKLGQNVIDLGKPRKGTYKITCSMGMVRPVTIRIQ